MRLTCGLLTRTVFAFRHSNVLPEPLHPVLMSRVGKSSTSAKAFRNPHNLPTKDCVVCKRPFTWRKKWEKCWDEVLTCSERCKRERRAGKANTGGHAAVAVAAIAGAAGGRAGKVKAEASDDSSTGRGEEDTEEIGDDASNLKACGDSAKRCGSEKNITADVQGESDTPDADDFASDANVLHDLIHEFRQISVEHQDIDDNGFFFADNEGSEPEIQEVSAPLNTREARRAHKKAVKAERRAQRMQVPEALAVKKKQCDSCGRMVDLLVRCTYTSDQHWYMLCGRCWKDASGGMPDGDQDHPHYRYGGLWKNRSASLATPCFPAPGTSKA